LFCWAVVSAVSATQRDHYDEQRIHNEKIEARFADWHRRTKGYAVGLEYSDHAPIA
jgi:hypothetical protein